MDDRSDSMPDPYDRQLGQLDGLPDVVRTRMAPVRYIPPMGVGGSQSFQVQTFRQRERGDTIFLEVSSKEGTVRLVIPPKVADVIARQRESLTTMARRKQARAAAAERKAQGIEPAFLKKRA